MIIGNTFDLHSKNSDSNSDLSTNKLKMAKKYTHSPSSHTHIKSVAEKNVTIEISDAFSNAYEEVITDVLDLYQDKVAAGEIADMLDFEAYDAIAKGVQNSLEAVYGEAAEDGIEQVSAHIDNYDAKAFDMFDLVNDDAKDYAKTRSAEMIGKKWVGDKLIHNPDAKWVITDTTRAGVKSIIEDAYEKGSTPDEVARALQTSYQFDATRSGRSLMIAKTEMTRASSQGTLAGWTRSGVVEGKEWIMGDDHDFEDDCDDNDDAGVIPIGDDFPSGDDGPPAHPNCNCSMSASVMEDEEI